MMLPRYRVAIAVLFVCVLLALTGLPGQAVENVQLSLGDIKGDGWSARQVTAQLGIIDSKHVTVVIQAGYVALPEGLGTLTHVTLTCKQAWITDNLIDCEHAELVARSSVFGKQRIDAGFRYRLDSKAISASFADIALHGGRVALGVSSSSSGWQFNIEASRLSLPDVMHQLIAYDIQLPVFEGDGRIDLKAHVQGRGVQFSRANIDIQLLANELSNTDGSIAAEQLDISLQAVLKQDKDRLQVDLGFSGDQGALYVEPLYVEMPDHPLTLKTRFDWLSTTQQLQIHSLHYVHPGSVRLEASGRLDLAADDLIDALQLEIHEAQFPSVFETYLKPWMVDTGFSDLDTRGRLQATVMVEQGALTRLSLQPQALTVDDREGRFDLDAMQGQLRWSSSLEPVQSSLSWRGGSIFAVSLGPAELLFESSHDSVQLLKQVDIPILDGALRVDSFQMDFARNVPLRWQVNGLLQPISLSDLTVALGWPELAGKLSGVIPDVRYDDGNLEVGGILLIRVFDGEVTLRNLTLEQPFGLVPRLQVDVRVDAVDLETLTRTFSFGKIEGRLDGRIDGLDMVSWQPVMFDAEFTTPVDDDSRHRISQKAVDNISSIGGAGVGGALSRSFLRFFEDFPYDRLGIRCRLQSGVCDMGGVAPAADGYYLVKGRFIPPRLDVIGYAERVNWDSLIAQIMAVTAQQEVVVE